MLLQMFAILPLAAPLAKIAAAAAVISPAMLGTRTSVLPPSRMVAARSSAETVASIAFFNHTDCNEGDYKGEMDVQGAFEDTCQSLGMAESAKLLSVGGGCMVRIYGDNACKTIGWVMISNICLSRDQEWRSYRVSCSVP